jgi:YidC/Oxa1 family membrane protein insertase
MTVETTSRRRRLQITYLFDDQPEHSLARESYKAFGGVGLLDKQRVFFLSPKEGPTATPTFERTASGSQRFGFSFTAGPQGETTSKSQLYAGRRRFLLMKEAGIQGLDRPGIGAKVMIPVIQFIDLLARATGNYGWAIILFTILTRLLLWPLMNKQMHSMARMQRLQPKLKRIQQRFKDDKTLLQQRMMELYKKEGINPMSGCLPMVIQLPIIFVIWRAILYAGEQIHLSPGVLWMPDLSLYDPLHPRRRDDADHDLAAVKPTPQMGLTAGRRRSSSATSSRAHGDPALEALRACGCITC